ncbi:MAG: CDP-archaeol synthase [Clostridia bacterium]
MTQQGDKKVSEILKRQRTGILLAAVLLVLWYIQGWPLRVGFVAMMVLAIGEMYAAFSARGAKPVRWVGLLFALLSMPAYLYYGVQALMPLTALCYMTGLCCIVLRGQVDFESAMATLFPLIYPGMLISLIFPLQDLTPHLFATVALGMSFIIALANDLAAYEIGRRFGKTKLCPALSPKKTREGAIAGVIASIVASMVVPIVACLITRSAFSTLPPLWHFAIVGLLGGFAAPIGDLTASMVKRYCGIKDFGSIFPGHGGMLDRVDSVIFTGAVVYCYFALVLKVL